MSRATLRTLVAALVLLVIAMAFLWGASVTKDPADPNLSIFLQNFGSFVLASLAIGLIFQFWQMRGLLDDMWEEAEIVTSLRSALLSLSHPSM